MRAQPSKLQFGHVGGAHRNVIEHVFLPGEQQLELDVGVDDRAHGHDLFPDVVFIAELGVVEHHTVGPGILPEYVQADEDADAGEEELVQLGEGEWIAANEGEEGGRRHQDPEARVEVVGLGVGEDVDAGRVPLERVDGVDSLRE